MPSSTPGLGIVVIGAGVVGAMRASTVRVCPDTALLAVVDAEESRARAAVRGTSGAALTDYRRAFDLPGVGAVIVSTPGHLHERAVVDALAAGKHVLCEKPLGTDVASCRRML